MSISNWSDQILVADLQDEPALSDDLASLIEHAEASDEARDVVLNLDAVTYLNSSNLAQLLDLRRIVRENGRSLRLCSLSESVWNLFTVTGLDRVFEFEENTATALTSLQLNSGQPQ